ncbi:hypothetical protein MMC07_009669 [Pseudocyphellaria aurata]|nr:hypothetical protein [Pseudocyphellaria aurata]
MAYVESSLRNKYPEEKLHILTAKGNSGSFTYDGIELGAERVTHEVEDRLEELEKEGKEIKKLSVVGYSLGGLVARYVVGLLYSKGWFSRLEPVNFTTFATPHLGVRTPFLGVQSKLWNLLASRTLSTSGRQLFTVDVFRNNKQPLLSVLADPKSIFIQALSRFKNRALYANIINDRSAPYYTTCITQTDPFADLEAVNINYLPKYSPNILDPSDPVSLKSPSNPQPLSTRLATSSQAIINGLPLAAMLTVLVPIGSVIFLVNSGIQSVRSQQRIRLHEQGRAGIGLGSYRIPLMIENAHETVEHALANVNTGPSHRESERQDKSEMSEKRHSGVDGSAELNRMRSSSSARKPDFPPLALTDDQLAMIKSLDEVGFRKYRVHIHKHRHSHAAIIARRGLQVNDEGVVVMQHWLNEEFEI